ncbi:MAG: sulfurtransferase [Planctomycetes bacterium]|nr:sulfurtransferase [Planctomycetota bacterium]
MTADWLAEHLGDPLLVVLDARDEASFKEGHIPGAVLIPYTSMYGHEQRTANDVASIATISEVFSQAGIDQDRTVIVYGDVSDYRPAAVVFWVLEVHGHRAAAVLNGGLGAWNSGGRQLSKEGTLHAPVNFVAEFRPERLADKLEARRAIADAGIVLLDSRSLEEYVGRKAKDGAKRAGHIPTAIHKDAKQLQEGSGEACSIKSLEQLQGLYGDLKGKRVYTYCNTGRSAALTYLALRALGIDAAVYDGSWFEWSADETLPIQTGPEPGSP